jgi:hypothetical protein
MGIKMLKNPVIIIFSIILILFPETMYFQKNCLYAEYTRNERTVTTRIVGSLFRTTARTYIATSNIEELKNHAIDKINSMDDVSFHALYIDFYEDIYDYNSLIINYDLDEDINKNEAIGIIRSMDKKKLYDIIDDTPDHIIVRVLEKHNRNNKVLKNKINPIEQIVGSIQRMLNMAKNKYF